MSSHTADTAATKTTLLLPAALRVVLRQRGDVAALAHVVDSLTDLIHQDDWTVAAAAERGHVHMLQYLAQRRAARDPQCPDLRFDFGDAMTRAARHGHMDAMRWLMAYRPDDLIPGTAMDAAAQGGHLEIVQWLHAHEDAEDCSKDAMDYAATNGHLVVVEWLHEHRTEGCSKVATTGAAGRGHLAVVQFLVNGTKAEAVNAFKSAAINGHLHVMRWLYEAHLQTSDRVRDVEWLEGRSPSWSHWKSTIDMAAAGGHLHVIEWLTARGVNFCTKTAMDKAAGRGHVEVVRWLHDHRSEGCTAKAMDRAARFGHLDVVRWLHEHRTEGCTTHAMNGAAEGGHLETVHFLHEHRTEGCTVRAINGAASNGHLEVVKFLHEHRSECAASPVVFENALRNGHLHIAEWLLAHRPRDAQQHESLIRRVAESGRLAELKWLVANDLQPASVYTAALREGARVRQLEVVVFLLGLLERPPEDLVRMSMRAAVSAGNLEVVKRIHSRHMELPVRVEEVECAASRGHLHIVQWLYEHRRPTEQCSTRAMNEAAGNGHLETVRWLMETQGQECTYRAIDLAARAGHLEVIRYLHDNGHAACTERAMEFAVTENHMRVVKWFVAHRSAQFYTERGLQVALNAYRRRYRRCLQTWLSQTLAELQRGTSAAFVV